VRVFTLTPNIARVRVFTLTPNIFTLQQQTEQKIIVTTPLILARKLYRWNYNHCEWLSVVTDPFNSAFLYFYLV